MKTVAIIFDVDGTLVDSNRLHAEAWEKTFRRHGHNISAQQVLPQIGKGGDKLVVSLLPDAPEAEHEAMRAEVSKAFHTLAEQRGIPLFPGIGALFAALRTRGVKTAIATSAKGEDFQSVMRISGFDIEDVVDEVVTGDEVEASKPDPDLIAAAIARLGLPPSRTAMVGDTPYDAEAARRAGAIAVGVLTGVHDEEALRAAGAGHVFANVAALSTNLDEIVQTLKRE